MVDARVTSTNFRCQKRVRGDFTVQVLAREIHRHQHGDVGFLKKRKNKEAVEDLKFKSDLVSRTKNYCYKCSKGRIQDFSRGEGRHPIIWPNLLQNWMNMKKIGLRVLPKVYYVEPPLAK